MADGRRPRARRGRRRLAREQLHGVAARLRGAARPPLAGAAVVSGPLAARGVPDRRGGRRRHGALRGVAARGAAARAGERAAAAREPRAALRAAAGDRLAAGSPCVPSVPSVPGAPCVPGVPCVRAGFGVGGDRADRRDDRRPGHARLLRRDGRLRGVEPRPAAAGRGPARVEPLGLGARGGGRGADGGRRGRQGQRGRHRRRQAGQAAAGGRQGPARAGLRALRDRQVELPGDPDPAALGRVAAGVRRQGRAVAADGGVPGKATAARPALRSDAAARLGPLQPSAGDPEVRGRRGRRAGRGRRPGEPGGQGDGGRRALLRGLGAGVADRGDPARALHRAAAVARRLPAAAELAPARRRVDGDAERGPRRRGAAGLAGPRVGQAQQDPPGGGERGEPAAGHGLPHRDRGAGDGAVEAGAVRGPAGRGQHRGERLPRRGPDRRARGRCRST